VSFAHDGLHDQLTRLSAPPHFYESLMRYWKGWMYLKESSMKIWKGWVFLNESLMDRSDKSEVLFQRETGYLDSSADLQGSVLETPYSLGLIIRELESMHISVKLAAP
jgi:hypothetical protein